MDFTDYRRHDAVGLAERVAKREVSAAELLDASIARVGEVEAARPWASRRAPAMGG